MDNIIQPKKLNLYRALEIGYLRNEEKQKKVTNKPNIKLLRKSLFWDTEISKIEWNKQFSAVIRRVFERGNEIEKQELIRFYGSEKINNVLNQVTGLPYTIYTNK